MAFPQLTYRESLREIEACLGSLHGKLYHMAFRGKVARSTLADANASRDWRIFADFAHRLIATEGGYGSVSLFEAQSDTDAPPDDGESTRPWRAARSPVHRR
jgi:hypothetical protein